MVFNLFFNFVSMLKSSDYGLFIIIYFLVLQDTGACLNIMYVRVFYKTCPQIQRGLALFPVTNTGPETTSLVDTPGSCVANASPPKNGPGKSTSICS